MSKPTPGPCQIVEENGKFKVYYWIRCRDNGQIGWKQRKKWVETHEAAVALKVKKERETDASMSGIEPPSPSRGGKRFGRAIKGRNGAVQEDWRVLLWAVAQAVADTPGDDELNERAKVIGQLATTAKKFLESGEEAGVGPADKFDPKTVLEQLKWLTQRYEKAAAVSHAPLA
jgi:hypothetical protein